MPIFSSTIQDHVSNTMSSPYYRFDGSNDEIAIADNAHMSFGYSTYDTPFSVSAWINMEDATNFPIITKGTYNTDGEWHFYTSGADKLYLDLLDESVASTYETAYTTAALTAYEGKWIHVCATYNGVGGTSANAGITLYVNGTSEAVSLAGGGTYVAMENLADEVRIGNTDDSTYAQGSISKLQIFNIELSAAEVKELYSGASVPFKYKGANQTALNGTTVENGINGGTREFGTSFTASSATAGTGTDNTDPALMYFPVTLVVGKKYRVTFDGVTNEFGTIGAFGFSDSKDWYAGDGSGWAGGSSITDWCAAAQYGGGGELWTLDGTTYTGEILCTKAQAYVGVQCGYSGNNAVPDIMSCAVTNMNIVPIGAVAEYDGSTAGEKIWGDKSGNDLHGTVSGATLENTPYDSGTEYEEGTWDAVITDVPGNPMTMDPTESTGYYTKVGNLVTVTGYIKADYLGSASGNIRMTGLPFTVANSISAYSGGGAAYASGLEIAAGQVVSYHSEINQTYIVLNIWDATTGTTIMQASEWSAGGAIILGFSYRAA